MKGKAIVPLVAGLCIGGFALKIGFDTLKRAQGAQTAMVKVWGARDEIPRGTPIDETMLQALSFPSKAVPKGAFTDKDKDKLVGRVPRINAAAGLPVVESTLLPPGSLPGIHVPSGLRAVAVRIDESSGVDNHLMPGVRVDVVGYFTVRREGKQETIARTLLENIEVAAVGQQISIGPAEDGEKKGGGSKPKPARAVTLLVKPESVPSLHLAEQRGKIKLSMRSSEDASAMARAQTANEADVLGEAPAGENGAMQELIASLQAKIKALTEQKGAVPPTEDPNALWTVTVWNGAQREVLAWKDANSTTPGELQTDFAERRGRAPRPADPNPPASDEPAQDGPNIFENPGDAPSSDQETEPEELYE